MTPHTNPYILHRGKVISTGVHDGVIRFTLCQTTGDKAYTCVLRDGHKKPRKGSITCVWGQVRSEGKQTVVLADCEIVNI